MSINAIEIGSLLFDVLTEATEPKRVAELAEAAREWRERFPRAYRDGGRFVEVIDAMIEADEMLSSSDDDAPAEVVGAVLTACQPKHETVSMTVTDWLTGFSIDLSQTPACGHQICIGEGRCVQRDPNFVPKHLR